MATEPSFPVDADSPAATRPLRRRSGWAAPVLSFVLLGIFVAFGWELEPLFYQPVRGEVVQLSWDTRWVSTSHRRRTTVGTGMLHKVRFPLVDYRYVVNGATYQNSTISRHPFEEWKNTYTRAVRGRAPGDVITVYVAPWAPDRSLLVRAPNFAILFILTVALFFASILWLAARAPRRAA
jgi:hypothetical protein